MRTDMGKINDYIDKLQCVYSDQLQENRCSLQKVSCLQH